MRYRRLPVGVGDVGCCCSSAAYASELACGIGGGNAPKVPPDKGAAADDRAAAADGRCGEEEGSPILAQCRVAANQRGRHSAVEPLTVGDRVAFAKGVSVWAAAAAPDNRRAGLALAGHTDVRTRRLRLILCCHIDECPEMTGTQRWAKCSLPPRLKRRGAPCSRSALN